MTSLHRLTAFLYLFISLAVSGCAAINNGGAPASSFSLQDDINALEKAFSPAASIEQANASGATKEVRNKFIDGRMALYDIRYREFIQKLGGNKQILDTTSDILLLGLNAAGALTGGVQAKANLAAGAMMITGSKTSIDKNFYFEKTMPALISTMNNQRKVVLLRLLNGRKNQIDDYSMTQALADLFDYEQAGTVFGAIETIQADAGVKAAALDAEIQDIVPASKVQIKDMKTINRAVAALITDATKLAEINRVLKEVGYAKTDFTVFAMAADAIDSAVREVSPGDTKKWMKALKL